MCALPERPPGRPQVRQTPPDLSLDRNEFEFDPPCRVSSLSRPKMEKTELPHLF